MRVHRGGQNIYHIGFEGTLTVRQQAMAGWTPKSIAGCVLWLDASQIVGLADGDDVGTWPDLSVSDNDAVQATAASKPHYKINIQNSLPGVLFDGGDDSMKCGASAFSGAGARTMIAVYHDDRVAGTSSIIGQSLTDSTRYYYHIQSRNEGDPYLAVWADDIAGGAFSNLSKIVTGTYDGNVTGKLFQNGAQVSTTKTYGAALTTDDDGVRLGHSHYPNEWQTGYSFELIVYNTALSDTDRGIVEDYLSAKWNIALP